LGVGVSISGMTVTLYPVGAGALDDALVSDVLDWLGPHPKAQKHFRTALKIYGVKDSATRRAMLDELRCALEQLLRAVLHNRKGLEKQAEVLLPWLGARGSHPGCINLFQTLLRQFIWYQNEAVKHDDQSAAVEAEFMVYLTGTFMRFLLQLEGGTPGNPRGENPRRLPHS